MNLLADEGIDKPIVDRLRQDGHMVVYIAEESPGITDEVILALANQQDAILATRDKDFGELVYRLNQVTQGVIFIWLDGLHPETKATIVSAAIMAHGAEMIGAFTIISPGNIRIRKRSD
jgi:predicted nuclease of predicted toxin-antitoxin system